MTRWSVWWSALLVAACTSGSTEPAAETQEGSAAAEQTEENEAAEANEETEAAEEAAENTEEAVANSDQNNNADPLAAPENVAAAPENAETTASGLASIVLQAGTGTTHPRPLDTVTVHYTGWTTDGEMFDSSVRRGQTSSFPLNRVIAGWTEGLQLMVVGEKRRFWIPANLAYGETPRGGRPGGMLVFDVELFEIAAAPEPPAVPEDVAAAPETAETTASGLASRVIEAGTGSVNPTAESTVRVHYTGWQTNGEMFDSSVTRGNPATFPLRGVIAGWTEGLQLMVEGETRRFWIPADLAYGENPGGGRPGGMLVFDVQLLEILN